MSLPGEGTLPILEFLGRSLDFKSVKLMHAPGCIAG